MVFPFFDKLLVTWQQSLITRWQVFLSSRPEILFIMPTLTVFFVVKKCAQSCEFTPLLQLKLLAKFCNRKLWINALFLEVVFLHCHCFFNDRMSVSRFLPVNVSNNPVTLNDLISLPRIFIFLAGFVEELLQRFWKIGDV